MFEEDGPGGKAVLKPYAVVTIFKWLAEVGAVPCSRVILHIYYIQSDANEWQINIENSMGHT